MSEGLGDEVGRLLAELLRLAGGANPPPDPGGPQYVTLDQAAALVGRSKRTLEKYLYDPGRRARYGMPDPTVEGGGGRPHEWEWGVLRPWLERVFRRRLPGRLPDVRRSG